MRVEALGADPSVAGVPVADALFLIRFYERRQFSLAWNSAAKLDALIAVLKGSERHGLAPADYHLDAIATLLERAARAERGAQAAERASADAARVDVDLIATDALARYAFHLRFGKVNPQALEPTWNFSRTLEGTDPVAVMQRLVDAEDLAAALAELAPRDARYLAMVEALAAYRAVKDAGGWPEVSGGETLRIGARGPRVAVLRERLRIEAAALDDPQVAADVFDARLAAAVQTFQRRHGLEPDGAVGARTLAALNVPVEKRIDELRLNLERMRWIFRDLEPRYIIVNIARFEASLVEDGEKVFTTRAVVGRPYRQTPVFRAPMTYLVLNPTWTVPPNILRNDLLPELRRDPEALRRRHMTVLDLSGREVDPSGVDFTARSFPYLVRQAPGPDNALGRVKFMFPNPYHVYMHDTPSRELFARADRSFSSGCIRLEQPLELAERLLAGTGQWDRAAIDAVIAAGRTRTVTLPRPVPVLLTYATAVAEAGEIYFLPDIYGRDPALLRALDAEFEFVPPAGYEKALSPVSSP